MKIRVLVYAIALMGVMASAPQAQSTAAGRKPVAGANKGPAKMPPGAVQTDSRSGQPVLEGRPQSDGTPAGAVRLLNDYVTARRRANNVGDRDTGFAVHEANLLRESQALAAGKPNPKSRAIAIGSALQMIALDTRNASEERANETLLVVEQVLIALR